MSRFRFGDPFWNGARSWRRKRLSQPSALSWPGSAARQERIGCRFDDQVPELGAFCTGRAARTRLSRLIRCLSSPYPGESESALAELELAVLLVRAGFRVEFLPESQSRTADLECVYAGERLFVEITAMVGSPSHRLPRRARYLPDVDDDADQAGHILIDRILARISQKAKQLADYCAPVVLAITMSDGNRDPYKMMSRRRGEELDLKRLSGAVVVTLPRVRQISAVLLSLWNVEPAAVRSGIRLANVAMVERPGGQSAYPRVRMLILNPAARFSLPIPVIESLKTLL